MEFKFCIQMLKNKSLIASPAASAISTKAPSKTITVMRTAIISCMVIGRMIFSAAIRTIRWSGISNSDHDNKK